MVDELEKRTPRRGDGTRRWDPQNRQMSFTIGQVNSVAWDQPPSVVNIGSENHVNLVFGIPSGVPGKDAPEGTGISITQNGFVVDNGLVKAVPPMPEVRAVTTEVGEGISLSAFITKEGVLELKVDAVGLRKHIDIQLELFSREVEYVKGFVDEGTFKARVSEYREKWVEAESKWAMLNEQFMRLLQDYNYFKTIMIQAHPTLIQS